ncbi:hypothetical protein BBJ28_00019689 [Nothophytophthora sp. Chile5]|nr:hypothetical protein BBJ28_00019689 [Nothophytophthora sp. Chile5]
MRECDTQFPHYGLAQHKDYPTKAHVTAIHHPIFAPLQPKDKSKCKSKCKSKSKDKTTKKPKHLDYLADMRESDAGAGTLVRWIRQRAKNMHGWMDWVITNNLPLSFCENPVTRRYTSMTPVCVETLRSAMDSVTHAVEAKIRVEMPDQFGIVIDGWSHASEHYLAVFACYEIDGIGQYPLLAMTPLINDESGDDHSARTHQAFLDTMLRRDYDKKVSDCLFIVGDNCAVNKKLATLLSIPLVGCASHRLNLAVQAYLQQYEEDLDTIHTWMKKLRTLNHAAKLRLKTPLRPVVRQDTRWNSTYSMVERYVRLATFLSAEDDEICELLPSARSVKRLRALLDDLARIESVSKSLQGANVTMMDARVWFDGLVDVEPSFERHLGSRAKVVHAADFEVGCCKVLAGETTRLTRAETITLETFVVEDDESDDDTDVGSFVLQLERKRKRAQKQHKYALLACIPPHV